ncbi:MAG TPA: hypothetical protein VK631_27520, partial [Solirubrobacteraceae bacterium]|nr:hypothetical protein [Solirubrobacteraceae bacterium]
MPDQPIIPRDDVLRGVGGRTIPGLGGRVVLADATRIELTATGAAAAAAAALAPRPVTVIRPADLLVITFSFANLQFSGSGPSAVLRRRVASRPAFLIVEFPSQHIVEKAFFEGAAGIAVETPEPPAGDTSPAHAPPPDPDAGKEGAGSSESPDSPPIRALVAGPSRLVFRIAKEEIPYTLEGLLAACSYLPLSVVPHAKPAPSGRVISVHDLVGSKAVDVKAAVAAKPSGRSDAARRAARFNGVGRMAAVSRSLTTAGQLAHRFGAEHALATSAQLSIGAQLGLGRFVDDLAAAGILQVKPLPRPPEATETALELPWRLLLSPGPDGGFAHQTVAVDQTGRVELWHSRLGVRITQPKGVRVDEELAKQRIVRAIWTRDNDDFPFLTDFDFPFTPQPDDPANFPDATGLEDRPQFRMALNSRDRMLLVHETSNFTLKRNLTQAYIPPPVEVDRLMLTSLGGWLSSDVQIAKLPDGPFSLQQWKHRATMGRDHEVKVVYAGFLFPFGHKASLVKVTERKFTPGRPGNPAYLYQRMFIIVQEPTRTYNDARTDS